MVIQWSKMGTENDLIRLQTSPTLFKSDGFPQLTYLVII